MEAKERRVEEDNSDSDYNYTELIKLIKGEGKSNDNDYDYTEMMRFMTLFSHILIISGIVTLSTDKFVSTPSLISAGVIMNTVPDAYEESRDTRKKLQRCRTTKKTWQQDFLHTIIGITIAVTGISLIVSQGTSGDELFSTITQAIITGVSIIAPYSGFVIDQRLLMGEWSDKRQELKQEAERQIRRRMERIKERESRPAPKVKRTVAKPNPAASQLHDKI